MSGRIEDGVAELASGQHGLVTRRQLLELGLTSRMVDRRLSAKRLRPVHRSVYLLGPLAFPRTREMAAVLACGAGTAISHGNAAWILEIAARPDDSRPVHVRTPGHVRVRRPGIRAHRLTTLEAGDVMTVDGIAVTSPARTLIDLAGVAGARELERAVARAERGHLVTREGLLALVARHRGWPGVATLAGIVDQDGGPAFTRSELEDRFSDDLSRFGLPAPRFNVRVAGRELDCYWPEARLAVELDGAAYHSSWQSQENDRRRDGDLLAVGVQVIRVTWRQLVHEPERTMVRVAQALAISRDRLGRGPGLSAEAGPGG